MPRTSSCSTTSSSCSPSPRCRTCCSTTSHGAAPARVAPRAARDLVGVELHHLGHEHARPRRGRRPAARARDHVREPRDGGRDPATRSGAARCSSSARTSRSRSGGMRSSRSSSQGAGSPEREPAAPHPHLVRRLGRVLARRRLRVGAGADHALAGRARDRLRRPLVLYRVPGPAAPRLVRVGRRDLALRRALPALHHHRARRVDRRSPERRRRISTLDAARLAAFGLAFLSTRGALVAVLRLRGARSHSGGSSSRRIARRWRETATRTSTSSSSPASSSPPSGTRS